MNHFGNSRMGRRGAALLGIVIVLVIILVLMMVGPFKITDEKTRVTQAQNDIERAGNAACMMNRRQVEAEVTQIQISNEGRMPPMTVLQQRFGQYKCPRGGAILVGKDGKVYCTKHDPPPIDELRDMMTLFEQSKPENKDETPPPLPRVTPMH